MALMLIADAVRRHAELPEFGRQIRGPGMFALCRPDEITTLLGAAGFDQVECDSYTPTILLGGGGHLDDSVVSPLTQQCPRKSPEGTRSALCSTDVGTDHSA
jgi:hypothetical protein